MDKSASMIKTVIGELLREKACVIIPHFGALMTTRTSARIDKAKQAIHPPGTEVIFNSGLTTNDGLLAQRLADKERISFAEALNKLQEEVDTWKSELADGEPVRLSGIGIFNKSGSTSIHFTPDRKGAFRPDTYGCNTVGLTPVKRSPQRLKKVKSKHKPRKVQESLTPSPFILAPVSVLITAILLAIGLNVPIFNFGDGPKGSLAPMDQANSLSAIPTNNATANDSDKSALPERHQATFHVIAGSFKQKQNARERANRLKNQGYQTAILDGNNGFHRVSVNHYQDSVKAMALVQDFKHNGQEPDAWLLKISHQRTQ